MPADAPRGNGRAINGSPEMSELYRQATQCTVRIIERLRETPPYQQLAEHIAPDALETYYAQHVWEALRPVMDAAWGAVMPQEADGRRLVHAAGLDARLEPLVRESWEAGRYPLLRPRSAMRQAIEETKARLRAAAERAYAHLQPPYRIMGRVPCAPDGKLRIAVEGIEGFDLAKRSDLFWLPESRVDPARVLVYFWNRHVASDIIHGTLGKLDEAGIPWITVRGGLQTPQGERRAGAGTGSPDAERLLHLLAARPRSQPHEAFAAAIARRLVRDVVYWRWLFRLFQVKIHFSLSPSLEGIGIAQRIAMDWEGGLHVGAQRSFIATEDDDTHGRRPHHLFFTWGAPRHAFSPSAVECGKTVVTAGFLFESAFSRRGGELQAVRAQLRRAGVSFTVALLDNAFGSFYITRPMVVAFYEAFLEWLLARPDVGLVLKPKKPAQFAQLHEIQPLLERARATGRCLVLPQAHGRLPSDASRCAELTVGLFIASSVIEAAIRGFRAVHCDLTGLRRHPFYRWGYERVVFDRLPRLLAAIERYRMNPASEPSLGDHGPVVEELDPFRDGRTGERVGAYLRWLLEAFDAGEDRETALQRTNERYAAAWGAGLIQRWPIPEQGTEDALAGAEERA